MTIIWRAEDIQERCANEIREFRKKCANAMRPWIHTNNNYNCEQKWTIEQIIYLITPAACNACSRYVIKQTFTCIIWSYKAPNNMDQIDGPLDGPVLFFNLGVWILNWNFWKVAFSAISPNV